MDTAGRSGFVVLTSYIRRHTFDRSIHYNLITLRKESSENGGAVSRVKALAMWVLSVWMLTTGAFVSVVHAGATPHAAASNENSTASDHRSLVWLHPRLFVANTGRNGHGNAVE